MTRYPLDRLYEEVAYLAYHFHWSREDILQLDHRERARWIGQIARVNTRLSEGAR